MVDDRSYPVPMDDILPPRAHGLRGSGRRAADGDACLGGVVRGRAGWGRALNSDVS